MKLIISVALDWRKEGFDSPWADQTRANQTQVLCLSHENKKEAQTEVMKSTTLKSRFLSLVACSFLALSVGCKTPAVSGDSAVDASVDSTVQVVVDAAVVDGSPALPAVVETADAGVAVASSVAAPESEGCSQ